MAIKVYGNVFSPATARVIATLYEKDLEFEFVPIDMKSGDHKKEPYLSIHPFGQVPAFEDGDLKLIESRAITQYIAHGYSDKGTDLLCPGKGLAVLAMWIEVEAHQYDKIASKLGWELAMKPMIGMTTDDAVVEENEAKLGKVLDVYETRLSQSKYLAGDHFTLADLHNLPTISYLMNTQARKLFETRPHVSAWVSDISARPAWCKFVEMRNNLN